MDKTIKKLEEMELENDRYRGIVAKQDCDIKLQSIKIIQMSDEFSFKMIYSLKDECYNLERTNGDLVSDRINMQQFQDQQQQTFQKFRESCKSRENQLQEKIQNSHKYEQRLQDEISNSQEEKYKIQNSIQEMRKVVSLTEQQSKQISQLQQKLQFKEDKIGDLEEEIKKLKGEKINMASELEKKRLEILEFTELKQDLKEQDKVLKKQEQMFQDFNIMQQEDQSRYQQLHEELNIKDKELNRSKSLNSQLSVEYDRAVQKIQEFEKELSHYRRENHELKRNMSLLLEKIDFPEKCSKMDIDQFKLELLASDRANIEVQQYINNNKQQTLAQIQQEYQEKLQNDMHFDDDYLSLNQ